MLEATRQSDGILLGPISHANYPSRNEGGINISAELRILLDLYANVRPSRTRDELPGRGRTPMDLVIVRENGESSRRIGRYGCELAMKRRRKLTVVHKANVLKVSEGVFLHDARQVAASSISTTKSNSSIP